MKDRRQLVLAWTLAVWLGASGRAAVAAPPTPTATAAVRIEASYLEYDRERRIAVLKENAYIEYDDLKLWADNIHDDLARDQVYAQGRIEMWRGREKYSGETLSYNYKTRRGRLDRLRTTRGVNRVEAGKVELLPERILGHDVTTTTCDHSPPHYRIQAKRMTLIPGERMVLENVRFRVSEKTWFRLPRYTVDLRTGEAADRFFLRPGYTAARGFHVKSAYQFHASDHLRGRLTFNPSQFEGTNMGTHFSYRINPANEGEFDFTRTESNLIRQEASRYQVTHRARMPWATADLNVLVSDTTFGALGTDSEMNVGAYVSRNFAGWTTQLALERRLDLDGDSYPFDQIQFLSSTPRLTFAQTGSTELFDSGVGLSIDGSIADIREETAVGDVKTGRAEVSFNVALPPVKIGDTQEINASIRQTEDLYGTGDMRHFFSFQANTFERYGDSLSSSFNYVYQDSMGDPSPFTSFDTLPPRQNLLTGYLRAGSYDRFNATLFQVTHDFVNRQYLGASSNFVYHTAIGGRRFVSLGLTPFYDLSRDPSSLGALRVGSVSANFRVASGDRWAHALITNYDVQNSRMQSVANRSGFLLNEETRLDVDSNLSRNTLGTGYDLTKLNLGITRDLHDFEGRVRWNAVQEEFFVEFYLKHASNRRLGLGVNYGDVPDLNPTFGDTGASAIIP